MTLKSKIKKVSIIITMLAVIIPANLPHVVAQSTSNIISSSGTIVNLTTVNPVSIKTNIHLCAYGLSVYSEEAILEKLSKFGLLIIEFYQGPDLPQIRALNPNVIILGYKDIMGCSPDNPAYMEIKQHEDWFLHDLNGNRLVSKQFGWYAMDVGNQGWREYYAESINQQFKNYTFDGVFADDVWNNFHYDKWTSAATAISSEIGERWHNDMLGMIQYVKDSIGDKLLIINTWNNGDYVEACDGKMEEEFVHPDWYPIDAFYDDYINWKQKVDALASISESGKYYLAQSGTSTTSATTEQIHNMMVYCYASYLLGANGEKSYFGFNGFYSGDGSFGYYDEFSIQLGLPLGQYYDQGSVYTRDFTEGKVIVNPTTTTQTIQLEWEYTTLLGEKISSITLNDHSGIILLK